jgi:hypothetical protein
MKITLKKTLLFITASILAFSASAQSDYVITVKGDSTACKISTPFIGGIKYKSEAMTESQEITPDEIKEYYIARKNTRFRSVFSDRSSTSKPVFMKVIEKGRISLYEIIYTNTNITFNSNNTYSTTVWYAGKGSDYVSVLKANALLMPTKRLRKDDFAQMLADNEDVYNKYKADDKFSFVQIRNLVHLYNKGSYNSAPPFDPPQKDYVIKKNKDTIFCEIQPGTFSTVSRYRIDSKNSFTKIDTTITEYFLAENSSTYLLKILPKNKRLEYVKCLVTGRINLYAFSLNNSTEDNDATLYASKESGDLIQIKHAFSHPEKDEKKAFTDLISDEPDICEKFKNLPNNFTSIFDCVKMYNSEYLTNNKPAK